MSAISSPFSPDTGPDTGKEQAWLRPGWLRPAALAAGLSLNLAAALLIGRARVETPQILPSINVSLVPAPYVPPPAGAPEVAAPAPEPAPLAAPEPEVTPPPAAAEPPAAIAPPEPPVVAPPPLVVDPAIERRKAEEAEKRRQERALELREAKKRQELEARQTQMRLEARREAQEKAQEKAKEAAKARQAAAEKGAQAQRRQVSGESRAAYGGVVVAEIQRRRPIGAARAGGATGQVGVTFTVGASGRIVSHRLDSSPDPRLAAAVGAIMAAVHAPPPPGGSFTAHTSLNFSAR